MLSFKLGGLLKRLSLQYMLDIINDNFKLHMDSIDNKYETVIKNQEIILDKLDFLVKGGRIDSTDPRID